MIQLFTDAGQYVIRFGSSDPRSKTGPARAVGCQMKTTFIFFSPILSAVLVIESLYALFHLQVQDLEIARPLTLSERAVTVALAISLDNDYFSRHGGW